MVRGGGLLFFGELCNDPKFSIPNLSAREGGSALLSAFNIPTNHVKVLLIFLYTPSDDLQRYLLTLRLFIIHAARWFKSTSEPLFSAWVVCSKAEPEVPASSSSFRASILTAKLIFVPSRSTSHRKR
jgi:hypothetical protein